MAETETYKARDPSLVWTLADLGLLDQEKAERNWFRWQYEWDHLEDLWVLAEHAWKQLPWWRRLRIGFSPGKDSWKIRWRQQHDPWREEDQRGQG